MILWGGSGYHPGFLTQSRLLTCAFSRTLATLLHCSSLSVWHRPLSTRVDSAPLVNAVQLLEVQNPSAMLFSSRHFVRNNPVFTSEVLQTPTHFPGSLN